MHGDIKMVNIVRFRIDNKLRLIDSDASATIVPPGGEDETFAGAKFSSAILPPEMIKRIETEEQLEEFNKYWESEDDEDLKEKVAPKPYKKLGTVKARYVVKSFRTEEGKPAMPVFEGLPYEDEELVRASESIDLWSLGVLAFTLLTGESLIPSTRDDDCASGNAMHVLYYWGTQPEVLSDLYKKITDDAARDLVMQLLKSKPEERKSVAFLLDKHPFFHSEMSAGTEDQFREMKEYLQNLTNQVNTNHRNVLVRKELSYESQSELLRTRHVLLKGIFEATEVDTPTTFIVLNDKLPEPPNEEMKKKILGIVTAEDGSGFSVKSEHASVTLSAEGPDFDLEGDLKEHYERVQDGIKWAKRIKEIGSRVAAGEVGKAFDIIKEGISDLIVGGEMYLYLIDELTGEPVRAEGWPLIITTPADLVPKLLPLMQVGIRAMCIYNGTAGMARLFGYPLPKVPKAWSKGAQESVELLKKESSVEDFSVVHQEVKGGFEEEKSVRGASLRTFVDFLEKEDPGRKDGKTGQFAGLQRIGDPEDGTALWTLLTDPADIEKALKERANQRKEEERTQKEHFKKMAVEELRELEEGASREIDVINELRSKSLRGDHATGKDLLGVLDEANAIADIISFKDLQLPFVVGIIGGWGSGKSFTYNLIHERLKEIQKYDLTDENLKKKFPFVGHIFLVKFDVWTFAKGNLWSSLMYRILTELNDQLDLEDTVTPEFIKRGVSVLELLDEFTTSGERKYLAEAVKKKSVQGKIRKWNPSGGNITEALIDATNSNYDNEVKDLVEKKQRLHEVTVKKKHDLAWRDVTAESNAKILPEIKKLIKDTYEQYAKEYPKEPVPQSVDAAMNSMKQWRGTLGWFKRYRDHFRAGRLSPLWCTVFLSSFILAVVLPIFLKKFEAIVTAIGPAVSVIFAKYHDAREKLKSAQEEISKVASEMHLDKEVLRKASRAANKAQRRKNTNDAEKQKGIIRDLDAQINDLAVEINSLEDRIWLREGDSLNKVVRDRVDLKHISYAMLSNKKRFPRGDPRIVLFIDDLDRCPPKKVVETLEAVQLLVNTKLFVVVLAIDTQYVTLCLEDEYKNILDAKRHPSGLDYIEKIIQLPYRVPPISAEYMKTYLQEQMNAKKKETRGLIAHVEPPEEVSNKSKIPRPNDGNQSPGQPNEKIPFLPDNAIEKELEFNDSTPLLPDYIKKEIKKKNDEATIDKDAPEPTKSAVAIPTEELESDKEAPEPTKPAVVIPTEELESDKEEPEPTKPAVVIPTEELEFTWEELEMLEDACMLSGVSPRSTRRLVNVFKLMKIIWYRRDQTPDVETPDELRMKEVWCAKVCARF
ncbi:serine/threonine-protein kinase [Skeletonema marinoi]|uniref:Serine/threonine-protein kinase n=1 Tax=Skeletonema marinoi TaxID=267567 RepID=A0AAD9DFV6_9STRA|nr:serine/threonine-protein kinase [Skeletonema marinoi]